MSGNWLGSIDEKPAQKKKESATSLRKIMHLSASIGDPIMLLRRAKQSGTYLTKGLTAKLWNRSEKYDLYPITLKSILEKKEKI